RRDADSIKVLSLGLGLEQRDGFVALAACVEHLRLEFDGSPAIRFLLFQPSQPSLRLLGLIAAQQAPNVVRHVHWIRPLRRGKQTQHAITRLGPVMVGLIKPSQKELLVWSRELP